MKEQFEPSIDPWELMVEHNQRIQRLEKLIQDIVKNQEEMAKSVNGLWHCYDIQKRTLDKLLENQASQAALTADILLRSTPSASGNH